MNTLMTSFKERYGRRQRLTANMQENVGEKVRIDKVGMT